MNERMKYLRVGGKHNGGIEENSREKIQNETQK